MPTVSISLFLFLFELVYVCTSVRYRNDGPCVRLKRKKKRPPHRLTQNEQGMWRCRRSRDRAVNAIYHDSVRYSTNKHGKESNVTTLITSIDAISQLYSRMIYIICKSSGKRVFIGLAGRSHHFGSDSGWLKKHGPQSILTQFIIPVVITQY